MSKFSVKEVSQAKREVYFEDDVHVCDFLLDVDGYFYCNFRGSTGGFSDWNLLEIGSLLKDLNKKWDDQIISYFENRKEDDTERESD